MIVIILLIVMMYKLFIVKGKFLEYKILIFKKKI